MEIRSSRERADGNADYLAYWERMTGTVLSQPATFHEMMYMAGAGSCRGSRL